MMTLGRRKRGREMGIVGGEVQQRALMSATRGGAVEGQLQIWWKILIFHYHDTHYYFYRFLSLFHRYLNDNQLFIFKMYSVHPLLCKSVILRTDVFMLASTTSLKSRNSTCLARSYQQTWPTRYVTKVTAQPKPMDYHEVTDQNDRCGHFRFRHAAAFLDRGRRRIHTSRGIRTCVTSMCTANEMEFWL
jgi:hypothetical protein